MEKKPGVESRRTPRRVFERPIGVLHHGVYEVAQALQLSEGGMLFISEEKRMIGEFIVVSLVMPTTGCLVVRGEMIYERIHPEGGFQYGVKFTPLQLNQRRVVRNYVAAKTQEEAEREAHESVH